MIKLRDDVLAGEVLVNCETEGEYNQLAEYMEEVLGYTMWSGRYYSYGHEPIDVKRDYCGSSTKPSIPFKEAIATDASISYRRQLSFG